MNNVCVWHILVTSFQWMQANRYFKYYLKIVNMAYFLKHWVTVKDHLKKIIDSTVYCYSASVGPLKTLRYMDSEMF